MAVEFLSKAKLTELIALLKAKIPTKTSQLTNDSNFPVDANYVHTDTNYTAADKAKLDAIEEAANNYVLPPATAALLGGVKIGANITVAADGTISVTALSWENINGKPENVSDFTNDAGYITKAVADLTNYYTKTETYTKTEVTTLIGDLKTISIQKVDTLPASGASNVIYLVPAEGSTANHYVEYIWVDGDSAFEPIGDTKIDLSNYWSKTELTEITSAEVQALFENW